MSDKPAKARRRWIGWAAGALLLLAAIVVAPFVLTTQLVRIGLGQIFPGNSIKVGDAALSLSGALTLRDVALRETVAQQPLVAIREVDAAFDWGELISRRIRKVEARDVTVYVGSGSQIGLLGLLYERSQPNAPARSNTKPLWIEALNVQGKIQAEPVKDIVPANTDWPLTLQMTMSGDRMEPSRQFRVAIGETRQLREKILKEPPAAADTSFGLLADVETRPATGGTRVMVRRLVARQAALAIEADTLRHYVPGLLRELHGRIETGLGTLSASGELDAQRLANQERGVGSISGSLSFAGFRVHTRGKSQVALNLDDMAGVAKIDTPLPPKVGTAITMERLRIRDAEASIPADDLRRYMPRLPPDLHGPIYAHLGALDLSGLIGTGYAVGFNGNISMHELSVHSPPAGGHAFDLEGLTSTARIESPLDRWAPAALKVREGLTQWVSLTYGTNAVYNLDTSWRIEGNMLTVNRFTARIFDGTISGSPALDLVTHEMPASDFQIRSINAHQALTNISPEHVDAEGNISGSAHLMLSKGELAGHLNLAFDGPGVLRVGQIEEVKRMLAGNFGLDMANLAMHDLEHYPFNEGSLYLESAGSNSQLKIRFVRQPRTKSDITTPRKEIINGKEVLVRSLVVPTIDMTIPITGKSLGEILSMASGISPLIANFSEQAGK